MQNITNLPETVSIKDLRKFEFGDTDAERDKLLLQRDCICATKGAEAFLRNRHSIILGERGTGKTALLKLVYKRKLKLLDSGNNSSIFINLDRILDYKLLREEIIPRVISDHKDKSLKHMLVWEIWILASIIERLNGEVISAALKSEFATFFEFFNIDSAKKGLVKLFLEQKKQVGVKLDPSNITNLFSWDFYASLDGSIKKNEKSEKPISVLQVGRLKRLINEYLEINSKRLYVLVDRLDEFVVKDEYEIQLNTLSGLLQAERSYREFPNIDLKLSMRLDLYERLDLQQLGGDKVYPRTILLEWDIEHIKHLMATRILHNYFSVLGLRNLGINVDREKLYIDRNSNDLSSLSHGPKTKFLGLLESFFNNTLKFRRSVIPFDSGRSRRTNLSEEIDDTIISSFLGDKVYHYDLQGKQQEIATTEYLKTHFQTGLNTATPRIIIWFLEFCISETEDYYNKNPDIGNDNITFPLIPKQCVQSAYMVLKEQVWNLLAHESGPFRENVQKFKNVIRTEKFTFNEVRKKLKLENVEDVRDILAILQHLGIIYCLDKSRPATARKYQYPMLFLPVRCNQRKST